VSSIVNSVIDLLFGDVTNILLLIVTLVVIFALTERWRIVRNAKRKRERQNRAHPKDV
jgi:heme exporter protein D